MLAGLFLIRTAFHTRGPQEGKQELYVARGAGVGSQTTRMGQEKKDSSFRRIFSIQGIPGNFDTFYRVNIPEPGVLWSTCG